MKISDAGFSAHVFSLKNFPSAQLERPADLSGSWPKPTPSESTDSIELSSVQGMD